jgi:hypothetical protein
LVRAEVCETQLAAQADQVIFKPGGTTPSTSIQEPSTSEVQPGTSGVTITPIILTTSKYSQLNLNFVVPKGKVSSLMGVLNFLQNRYNHIEVSLNINDGSLSEQEYEDKIKEAFRQMGIDIGD